VLVNAAPHLRPGPFFWGYVAYFGGTAVAALIGIDPWLIDPEFAVCGKIDFQQRAGIECLAENIDKLLHHIRVKYREYAIDATPFVVVKAALADSSPLAFISMRFIVASTLLALVFRPALAKGRPNRAGWAAGCGCALFLFLGFAFQTAGLRFTSASNSAFLTGLYVVMVPLISSALSGKAVRAWEWAACFMALAGTGLMTGAGSAHFNKGDLLTIASAAAFSAHMVAVAHWSTKLSYEWLTTIQVALPAR
jgi:drug/metabolite transporter (DMT)-like permease